MTLWARCFLFLINQIILNAALCKNLLQHMKIQAQPIESSVSWIIESAQKGTPFLAATKQLYEWFSPSVRPSVCLSVRLSVRHTFLTMFPSSYHHEIFRSHYQWQKWRPCKRSRSKVEVTEVTTQLNRFRTVTPVWMHIWCMKWCI